MFLNHEYIYKIINLYNPNQVNLSGGEPLLDNNIFNLIEWLNFNNIQVNIYTSGVVDNIENILLKFKKLNINKIIFSVYSIKPNLHNSITNCDSFKNTINAIKLSLSLKLNTEIYIVPMKINLYDLDKTINNLNNMRIKKISLLKLVKQGRAIHNEYLIPEENLLKQEILKLQKKYSELIRLGSPFNKQYKCLAGKEKLVIQPNGNIIPCEAFKSGKNMCQRI